MPEELCGLVEQLVSACKCALADLEGLLPGCDEHPGWETVTELRQAIAKAEACDASRV